MDLIHDVWPVLAAAVVQFIIGALWYGALFSKPWIRAMNLTQKKKEEMKKGVVFAYISAFIGYLITSYVIALVVAWVPVTAWMSAILLGAILWAGFSFSGHLNALFFEKKPRTLFFIDCGHYICNYIVAAVIIVVWPW